MSNSSDKPFVDGTKLRAPTFQEKNYWSSKALKQTHPNAGKWLGFLAITLIFGPFIAVYPYWDITIAGVLNAVISIVSGLYLLKVYGGQARVMGITHILYIFMIIYVIGRCFVDNFLGFGLSKILPSWQAYILLNLVLWNIIYIMVFR
eukprot:UN06706